MRDLDVRLQSRIKGRPALERRLRGLLIAVHRFARGRAQSHDDLHWCARTADGLSALLRGGESQANLSRNPQPDCLTIEHSIRATISPLSGNASATAPKCLKTVQMSDSADQERDCGGRA